MKSSIMIKLDHDLRCLAMKSFAKAFEHSISAAFWDGPKTLMPIFVNSSKDWWANEDHETVLLPVIPSARYASGPITAKSIVCWLAKSRISWSNILQLANGSMKLLFISTFNFEAFIFETLGPHAAVPPFPGARKIFAVLGDWASFQAAEIYDWENEPSNTRQNA